MCSEIYDHVELKFFNRLSTVIDKSSVGLYRDNGLAPINNANGPKLHRIRKDIITSFKEERLSITIETNLVETDYLDVTFNLATKKHFSFWKANNAYHSTSTPFLTTHLQSSNSCLKRSTIEFQIYILKKEEFDKVKSVYKSLPMGSEHFSSMYCNNRNTQNEIG